MKQMIINDTEFCTLSEAARMLHVSKPTVWRWVQSGKLPAVRVGGRAIRVRQGDLAALVQPLRPGYQVKPGANGDEWPRGGAAIQAVSELERGQEEILRRRGGKRLSSSVETIRAAREERARIT